MALTKRVKQGGSYYQGYELIVSSAPGDYVLNISQTQAATINSISVTPDVYGTGDTYSFVHLTSNTQTSLALLGNSIYNLGAGVSQMFDFPALEPMQPNEVLRFTYTNTATRALLVHLTVEYVGITRTT